MADPSVFLSINEVTLAVILGALAAIVYMLRILVLVERRIARMDENLERLVLKIAKEERKIESEIDSLSKIKRSSLKTKKKK